jgi:hypothetical protein
MLKEYVEMTFLFVKSDKINHVELTGELRTFDFTSMFLE